MSSRKEEERNERIIRGLLKLPPNRKCINCNSLGPQYVCTNFWTFVCITCSGIHREFTHRVKSVSMAKFTSQEVEALENGGNQRAREIYLKDWDMQRQRLPESSNVEKIREFIKSVYVDKKYAGGRSSDKPPRDTQNYRNHEEERRASSYHSYSQSPPYDHQYEDRRYGKQTGMLTRKPGSDREQYDGRFSSLIYSPRNMTGHAVEDRFANEGSGPRLSDYSVSSAGDASRHSGQSPNFHKEVGYSSPPVVQVRNILIEDGRRQTLNTFLEADSKGDPAGPGRVSRSHRPASFESFGSSDSNSPSLRSVKSGNLIDVLDRDRPTEINPPTSSSSKNEVSMGAAVVDQGLFGSAAITNQLPINSTQNIDLFADIKNPVPSTSLGSQIPNTTPPVKNEGWATFDMPPNSVPKPVTQTTPGSALSMGDEIPKAPPFDPFSVQSASNEIPKAPFDPFSFASNNLQHASVLNSSVEQGLTKLPDPWKVPFHQTDATPVPMSNQPWNAFGSAMGNTSQSSFQNPLLDTAPQMPVRVTSYDPGLKFLEGQDSDNFPGFSGGIISGHDGDNASFPPFPSLADPGGLTQRKKSTNPFDLPYESELKNSNLLLDMSPLQAALPNPQFSAPSTNTSPWFSQFSVPSGSLPYMAQPPSQIPNLPPQGPMASLGGNPFA